MTDPHEALDRAVRELANSNYDPEVHQPHPLLQLGDLIQKVPGPWCSPLYSCLSGTRTIVQPHHVATLLVRRVREGGRPRDVLAEIGRLLGTRCAEGMLCAGLIGPVVGADTELATGLTISPASEFPHFSQPPWVNVEDLMHPVTCCIRIQEHMEPVFTSDLDDQSASERDMSESHRTLSDLQAILVLFTCPVPVTSAGTCFVFDDPAIDALSHASRTRVMTVESLRRPPGRTKNIDSGELQSAWAGWAQLQDGDRKKLRIACDRINRSLLQARPVDRCIEACIALEVLLGGGRSDSITHKIATRCARYLHTALDQRVELSRFIKRMYNARSSGVHAGELGRDVSIADLERLSTTVAAVVRRMIEGGVLTETALDFEDGSPDGGDGQSPDPFDNPSSQR